MKLNYFSTFSSFRNEWNKYKRHSWRSWSARGISAGIICGPHRRSFAVRDHLRFGDHFRSGIICGAVLILTQDSPIGGIDSEKKQQTRTLRMLSAQFLRRTWLQWIKNGEAMVRKSCFKGLSLRRGKLNPTRESMAYQRHHTDTLASADTNA